MDDGLMMQQAYLFDSMVWGKRTADSEDCQDGDVTRGHGFSFPCKVKVKIELVD